MPMESVVISGASQQNSDAFSSTTEVHVDLF